MLNFIIYFLVLYLLSGIGTSMGYHRLLTHKSAEIPKWFEHLIVIIGLPAGTPIQWVGNHRAHHGFTDKKGDPHSPYKSGFWFAHCGWYVQSNNTIICIVYAILGPLRLLFDAFWRPRTNQEHIYLADDIRKDALYVKISQPFYYQLIMLIYFFILILSSYFLFGYVGLVYCWLSLVIIYNIGDSVDSFGHIFGQKTGNSQARNNKVLGWLAFGDGWHSNHHINPRLAKHGQLKYQFDLTYLLLKMLKKLGVVKKINENGK